MTAMARVCENPVCGKTIDPEKVRRFDKRACDGKCRAAAWKARTGYGRADKPPQAGANGQTKRTGGPSGLQVSFRRASVVLAREFEERGVSYGDALTIAETVLARALSDKQKARLREPHLVVQLSDSRSVEAA